MSDLVEPIAIVGLAGRFPGAHDIEEFWANLRDGRTGLRTVSEQDLLAAGVPVQTLRDKSYVPVNGDAPDIDMFDASFFGMTPREATICDPQLRMFLETAHAAVENATALSPCTALKITGEDMIRVMRRDRALRDRFFSSLLARTMRAQADLVDHLFNCCEKRLARMLLLIAQSGRPHEEQILIPPVTQEALAEMIG